MKFGIGFISPTIIELVGMNELKLCTSCGCSIADLDVTTSAVPFMRTDVENI
jgi:hypothetical protein